MRRVKSRVVVLGASLCVVASAQAGIVNLGSKFSALYSETFEEYSAVSDSPNTSVFGGVGSLYNNFANFPEQGSHADSSTDLRVYKKAIAGEDPATVGFGFSKSTGSGNVGDYATPLGTFALGIDDFAFESKAASGLDYSPVTIKFSTGFDQFGGYFNSGTQPAYVDGFDNKGVYVRFYDQKGKLIDDAQYVDTNSLTGFTFDKWFGWQMPAGQKFYAVSFGGYTLTADNLTVGIATVPEPATLAAFALGVGLFVRRRRK